MEFLGQNIALFHAATRRFVQLRTDGIVSILDDDAVSPANIEPWRAWETFAVVIAGCGKIALHCAAHNRFLRVIGDNVDAHGGPMNITDLPPESEWPSERFTIVDAGNGMYAIHNSHHNRFIRVYNGVVDTGGGVRKENELPSAFQWPSERFHIVIMKENSNLKFIGRHIALFNCSTQQFVQMKSDGAVSILNSATPDNIEPWRTWETFRVVDAGYGKVALHCAAHNRFLRVDGERVNALGGPMSATDLPPVSVWPC